ncbi:MAG: S1/P1 nuclease [Bacteroidales bacterium]|nr:S1/P1 nuclease [Bacteroidales bacterium]
MKKFMLLGLLLTVVSGLSPKASAWGVRGHEAIAYIAELNLKPETKAIVEHYLGGKSIVYYAVYLDQMRFIHECSFIYKTLHHGAEFTADLKSKGRDGSAEDALFQMTKNMERLGNGQYKHLPDSVVTLAIQCFIHQMGDVHCPVHMSVDGRKANFPITRFGKKSMFHAFWDDMPETGHDWGYMEYGHQLNRCTPEQIAEITKGSLYDWGEEVIVETLPVWDYAAEGGELAKPYIYKVVDIMDSMIIKGGYRLAYVLNTVFK